MKFDEVENLLLEQNLDDDVALLVAYEMSVLKETYAPTVKMTKEDKQSLLDLKSRATFYYFNQSIKRWQQDRRGLQIPYGLLTEDELMQAWLHPETIRVIDDEQ